MFENCYEVREAFRLLFLREDKLQLVTGELFPTERLLEDEGQGTEMVAVEHLGQYVFEMTNAKVEALKRGEEALDPLEENMGDEHAKEAVLVEKDQEEEEEEQEEEEGEEGVAEVAAGGGEDVDMPDLPE